MNTSLIEFKNSKKDILRGILLSAETDPKKYCAVMLGGFERAGTTEKKFKALADKLAEKNISSFRFDAADCGLSDGNFYQTTVESLAADLSAAIEFLRDRGGYEKFSLVGHSLTACVFSLLLEKISIEKIVLLAPALNQRDLFRYWFVQKKFPDKEITWDNYPDYFDEKLFDEDVKLDLITKTHKLSREYRNKNKDIDYSGNYLKYAQEKILYIHGMADDVVPPPSLKINFLNKIIIDKGGHDLERPGIIEQWLGKAADFLEIYY
ncbi:MAG TPA: alpha/beta hydrolase [Candidatus Nanoarchaeia archaeon]|nr:alpha/beta hydrolase [Candidatus Nanoarchaeia archaeon]